MIYKELRQLSTFFNHIIEKKTPQFNMEFLYFFWSCLFEYGGCCNIVLKNSYKREVTGTFVKFALHILIIATVTRYILMNHNLITRVLLLIFPFLSKVFSESIIMHVRKMK